jgi:hypothetical protein
MQVRAGTPATAPTSRDIRSWPVSSIAVMQQIGGDRKESGHPADIVDRSKMDPKQTLSCIIRDPNLT